MRTIRIFLASSGELKADRLAFEIEINRKNKLLAEKEVFRHLDIWEDLSAQISQTCSQDEYNTAIEAADMFVLLAWNKVGIYTEEEFDVACDVFRDKKKLKIFTWFKEPPQAAEPSLDQFKKSWTGRVTFSADTTTPPTCGFSSTKSLTGSILQSDTATRLKASLSSVTAARKFPSTSAFCR